MKKAKALWLIILLALALCLACNSIDDDDNDDSEDAYVDTAIDYQAPGDDDSSDDDTGDDDDQEPIIPPETNSEARADAFRLFYRERTGRTAISLNRFALFGDSVMANAFDEVYIAKTGDEYQAVPGPLDNNPIGMTLFTVWELYQAIGGRPLELTLIRLFEGLVFTEQVSGHPGLTCREAYPGWTRRMDGKNRTVQRTRLGQPVTSPVVYAASLEREILDSFYDGIAVTYRENPEEFYFNFKPINDYRYFSRTWVFSELPNYLRSTDCCSSLKITPPGYDWAGAFWGNHNSRDNWSDLALGFLTALDAAKTAGLPEDLAQAAKRAAAAGRRTGDAVVEAGMILMTVLENSDYQTLRPSGCIRPFGPEDIEWQDLGSLGSCTYVYAAQALSSQGLSSPVPELPLPGDLTRQGLQYLFDQLGIPLELPPGKCTSVDDLYLDRTIADILEIEVLGLPWWEFAEIIARASPGIFAELLGGSFDDFTEMVLGSFTLCYYAQIVEDQQLYEQTRQTLRNLIELTNHLNDLIHFVTDDPLLKEQAIVHLGAQEVTGLLAEADQWYYLIALYGRAFDIHTDLENFGGFDLGDRWISDLEQHLTFPDTTPKPLLTDQELHDLLFNPVNGYLVNDRYPWITERYLDRFGEHAVVRRAGDGYEAIGPNGSWIPTENDRHRWLGDLLLWQEAILCNTEKKHTLDCYWARLGCAPADLSNDGLVDDQDTALFNSAWETFGEGAACTADNQWCAKADLDKNGVLDADDRDYLSAAIGCIR